jgi:hypothetical protein
VSARHLTTTSGGSERGPARLLVLGGLGRLRAEHAELKAENAELRAQNAELAERIARLERLVSRNSENSSMLPSADDLPGKKPPPGKPRRGGGRKPGKQPGAPGAYLGLAGAAGSD